MDIYKILISCPQCGYSNKVLIWNQKEKHYCTSCGEMLFKSKKPEGILYILSHKNMPGLVKIGMTRGPVKDRVQQLSSATGVPGMFTLEAWFVSEKPEQEEKKIHDKLKRKKEWSEHFRMDIDEAINKITRILNGRTPVFRKINKRKSNIETRKSCGTLHNCTDTIAMEQANLFDFQDNDSYSRHNYMSHEEHNLAQRQAQIRRNMPCQPYSPNFVVWTCPKCGKAYKFLSIKDTATRRECPNCSIVLTIP